jgi:hypothetical protein
MAKNTTMIVNPFLDLSLAYEEGSVTAITVRAPVKGEGLKVTTIDRNRDPELFGLLVIYCHSKGADLFDSITESERELLNSLGFLVTEIQVPRSVYFSCDLDDMPADLLPHRAHARSQSLDGHGELIVDPTFQHLGNATTPVVRKYKLSNPFPEDRSWLSIVDGLSAPVFYSYTPDTRTTVESLSVGQPVPKSLSSDIQRKLFEAGVLRPRGEISSRSQIRERERAAAHESLVGKHYVVLHEIVHSVQLAAIRRYYRELIDEGFVRFGDPEWPDRFLSARDGLAYFFQQQLTPVISEIAGEKVKPSFSFFASYRPGSELKAHRDREQCHYALTIMLDHNQPEDLSSWPIYVHAPGEPDAVPIRLNLGDGLLYFGEEVLHYRPPLTNGHSTHWFLFWVPQNFEGSLD